MKWERKWVKIRGKEEENGSKIGGSEAAAAEIAAATLVEAETEKCISFDEE